MTTSFNAPNIDLSMNLSLLSPIINNNDISNLKDAIQLCYEFYRIMDIRTRLIMNYHCQKMNDEIISKDVAYKKYLFLNQNTSSYIDDEYSLLGYVIYKQICSIIPNNPILQDKFYNMTTYDNNEFRALLANLNIPVSLSIMNYSKKPFVSDSDKTLMKSWTIMLNNFILKIIHNNKNNDHSINQLIKLQTKINKIIR